MNGFKPLLHIGPDAQLKGRADQNAYFPRIEFAKQLQFAALCMVVVDKRDLRCRNVALYQLLLQRIVNIECIILWGRIVTKYQLCHLWILAVQRRHTIHTLTNFGVLPLRLLFSYQSQVKRSFSPVRADLQHIVHATVHHLAANRLGSFAKGIHISSECRKLFDGYICITLQLRHIFCVIHRMKNGYLREHPRKLRKIEKFRKSSHKAEFGGVYIDLAELLR